MLSCGLTSSGQWTHTIYFAYARTTRQHLSCGLGPNGHELIRKIWRTHKPQDGNTAPTHPAHFQSGSLSRVQSAPIFLDGFQELMPRSPTFSTRAWIVSFRAVSITSSKCSWKWCGLSRHYFAQLARKAPNQLHCLTRHLNVIIEKP